MSAEHPTTAKDDEIRDRRSRVWQMRVDGQTVREIAADLRVSVGTIQSDLNAVRAELDEGIRYNAETDRAISAARLDKVVRRLIASVDLVEEDALPGIANAVARNEERRAKLLGLDAPSEAIIHQTDASPEEARRLMAEKFGRTAKRESAEQEGTETDEQPQAI